MCKNYTILNDQYIVTQGSGSIHCDLSDQCKEIEETTEWERLGISSRKSEIPREHFMQNGHNKGQKWYGSKKQKILRRGGKNTQNNYTKKINDLDNHDGVIMHLEPDILKCKVKCALGSITTNKVSGGDGIPVELYQILKDDAVKVLHSRCQQIWKTQ